MIFHAMVSMSNSVASIYYSTLAELLSLIRLVFLLDTRVLLYLTNYAHAAYFPSRFNTLGKRLTNTE